MNCRRKRRTLGFYFAAPTRQQRALVVILVLDKGLNKGSRDRIKWVSDTSLCDET